MDLFGSRNGAKTYGLIAMQNQKFKCRRQPVILMEIHIKQLHKLL